LNNIINKLYIPKLRESLDPRLAGIIDGMEFVKNLLDELIEEKGKDDK